MKAPSRERNVLSYFAGTHAIDRHRQKILKSGIAVTLMIGGLIVVIIQSRRLSDDWARRDWPVTEGVVVASHVSGTRAFHPGIRYTYTVGDRSYEGVSDLDVPGFGTKSNRLNVAERSLVDFPAGKKITVHYDPEHPDDSRLRVAVPMATFLFLSIGGLCSAGGILWSIRLLKNPSLQ